MKAKASIRACLITTWMVMGERLTIREMQERFNRVGISPSLRTVQRDMSIIMECVSIVESEKCWRDVYYFIPRDLRKLNYG